MSTAPLHRQPAPPANAVNVPTVCVLCSHNCGLRVNVEDNRITAVRGDTDNPNTRGYTCNKARAIPNYVQHGQRLSQPLRKRSDGRFEPISWDQAIAEIADRLNRIRARHAPRSIALAGIGGQGNHMAGMGSLPFMFSLDSPILFNALAQEKTQHAMVWRRLFRATHDVYLHADEEHSQHVLVLGTNPLISNRGLNATDLFKQLASRPDCKVVVVDPRASETARRAHRHIAIQPGRDAWFLLGMVATILQEGLQDEAYLRDHVADFAAFREALIDTDVRQMAQWSGVPFEVLQETALDFARSPSACIVYDLGIEQIPHSTLISYLINALLLITGNVGEQGGNTFLQQFGPRFFHVARQVKALESGIEAIPMLMPAGVLPPNVIPEEIQSPHPDRIRALIVDGANPLLSYADTQAFREAFQRLDLLVVIEPAMSETAQVADYVLPTPVGYEKWEYSMFPHMDITPQIRPPVVSGPEEALPEPEIYRRLIRAMGVVPKAPALLHRLARRARHPLGAPLFIGALGLLAALRGGGIAPIMGRLAWWLQDTLGAHLPSAPLALFWLMSHGYALTRRAELNEAIPQARTLRNPFAAGELVFNLLLQNPQGVLLGRRNVVGNFRRHCHHADGKARLHQPDWIADLRRLAQRAPQRDPAYPIILNGGLRTGWTANTIVRDPAWRKGKGPHCPVIVNPQDAAELGIAEGDWVRLSSRRGAVEGPVRIEAATLPGHVHIPNGFGVRFPDPQTGELRQHGINVNELLDIRDRDPYTGCPHTKHVACKLEPLRAQQAA